MRWRSLLAVLILVGCRSSSGTTDAEDSARSPGQQGSDTTTPSAQDISATSADAVPYEDPTFVPVKMDLPVVTITTDGAAPITSTDDYVTGHITLRTASGTVDVDSNLRVRGRGHTTWGLPKKPYKLKFDDKTSLLGMPSDKEWALLAGYSDKTLVRTATAFELAKRLGMKWTPRYAYVEVFLNGEYEGVYQLAESVKIAKDRVNITELDEDDESDTKITGGYLLEYGLDGLQVVTPRYIPFELHEPDPPTTKQLAYVTSYIGSTEDNLYSDAFTNTTTGWASRIDMTSFVQWYLVNEIFANNDAQYLGSMWLAKDRSAKLTAATVWDFDLGAGNVNYTEAWRTDAFWVKKAPWFDRLFLDPVFANAVRTMWRSAKATQIDTLPALVDALVAPLANAQANNYKRWLTIDKEVWPNHEVAGTYEGEVAYLKTWLTARIAWLDAQYQ